MLNAEMWNVWKLWSSEEYQTIFSGSWGVNLTSIQVELPSFLDVLLYLLLRNVIILLH